MSSSDRQAVACIGLGLLGSALALRLMAQGSRIIGFDPAPLRSELAGSDLFTAAAGVEAAAKGQSIVLLCLPNSDVAADVLAEIEPVLEKGVAIVDTTTGDPEMAVEHGRRLATRGVAYIDAPIGGSSEQARRGEAIVVAGATQASFAAALPTLRALSRQTFHAGPCGSGRRMKLVMNLVIGLNRAVLAEALMFAKKQEMNLEAVLEVLQGGPAYSRVMDVKGDKMLQQNFEPVARLNQHLKDVRLILAAGESVGATLPLSRLHAELLEKAAKLGYGGADNSAIIKAFEVPE